MPIIDESMLDPMQSAPSMGGRFISEAELDPIGPAPTTSDYSIGALKGIGRGALDLFTAPADLLYRGGNWLAEKLGAPETDVQTLRQGAPSARAKQFFDYLGGSEGNQTAEDIGRLGTNLATMIAIPSQGANIAKNIPIIGKSSGIGGMLAKALGYGTEGAGYTALAQSNEDNPLKNAEYGAALNVLGAGLGKGAQKLADKFLPSADALERGAVGALPGDFSKSLKYKGAVNVGTDEVSSRLAQSIRNISKEGGFAGAKDPASLYNKTVESINKLGESLDPIISQADDAIKASGIRIYPKFTEAQKFVNAAKATERADLQKLLDESIQAYKGDLDGSLSSIHELKKQLYRTSYTEAGKAKDVLDTAIAKDLKRTVEQVTDSVLPKAEAGTVKAVNARLGDYLDYKKIATRELGKEQGKNIGKTIAKGIFTTGGIGAPTIIGGITGGQEGAVKGALLGAGLLAAGSKGGQFALSKLLRGIEPAAQLGAKIPTASGKLGAAILGDQGRTSQENNSISNGITMNEQPTKPAFDAKLDKVASNLGIRSEDLRQVIKFETGGTFSPSVKNPGSSATGLIQFIGSTAKGLTGKDTEQAALEFLSSMTAEEQLDYVEKHLKPYAGRIKSFEDLYMAILRPSAIGKPNDYPLFKEGSEAYNKNDGLDLNKDGIITKLEASSRAKKA